MLPPSQMSYYGTSETIEVIGWWIFSNGLAFSMSMKKRDKSHRTIDGRPISGQLALLLHVFFVILPGLFLAKPLWSTVGK